MTQGTPHPPAPTRPEEPGSGVKMPRPEARQNPNLSDIQEGSERMQGEPVGRQAPNPRDRQP
ncbi:MAG TPA: hypothetical protein VH253_01495 [Phycisphaerae bacterium]|nr:hypothetical protein [Phycisphaerae bacterium]